MKHRLTEASGVIRVALEGSLNFAANDDFQLLLDSLIKTKPRQVIFELAHLTAIDSVGLGLLHIACEDLSGQGAKVSLAGPAGSVARLLELTEANKMFEILP
jgi:anti-sigma B factor antagonist